MLKRHSLYSSAHWLTFCRAPHGGVLWSTSSPAKHGMRKAVFCEYAERSRREVAMLWGRCSIKVFCRAHTCEPRRNVRRSHQPKRGIQFVCVQVYLGFGGAQWHSHPKLRHDFLSHQSLDAFLDSKPSVRQVRRPGGECLLGSLGTSRRIE